MKKIGWSENLGVPLTAALLATLLWTGAAEAVNNRLRPPEEKAKLAAVLQTIHKGKALVRREQSRTMAAESTPLEQEWGIKLQGIRSTAAGYMLEMTFRVLDSHKAFPLLKRDIKRYMVVEKSGAVLEVPFTEKLGPLRSTVRTSNMVREDTNYVALFANPAKHVRPGDRVDLVIGNFMAEKLVVQ